MKKELFVFLLFLATSFAAVEDMLTLVTSGQETFPSTLESGYEGAVLQITIRNTGMHLCSNLTLTASFSEPLTAVNNTYTIGQISPGEQRTAVFTFNIGTGAGTYTVPIWVEYYDVTGGGSLRVSRNAYLSVSITPRLEISSVVIKPVKVSVGGRFIANVTVTNVGGIAASGINLNISVNNAYVTFITAVPKYIPSILPGQSKSVAFEGAVSSFSPVGGFSGRALATFDNRSTSSDFLLPVEGGASLSVTPNNSKVGIGVDDKFTFLVSNIGEAELSDVKVLVESNISIFTDMQVFVGDIGPGETKALSLQTLVDRRTPAGIYQVTIILNSSQGERREKVNLDVYGVPTLRLAGVTTDETPYVGVKTSLSVQLENIGTDDARGVTVRLVDLPATGGTEVSVGTIEVDDSGSAVFDLYFQKDGDVEVKAEVTYLDNSGNAHTTTLTSKVYVAVAPANFTPVVGLVFLAVVVGFFLYRRHDRKHKLAKI